MFFVDASQVSAVGTGGQSSLWPALALANPHFGSLWPTAANPWLRPHFGQPSLWQALSLASPRLGVKSQFGQPSRWPAFTLANVRGIVDCVHTLYMRTAAFSVRQDEFGHRSRTLWGRI